MRGLVAARGVQHRGKRPTAVAGGHRLNGTPVLLAACAAVVLAIAGCGGGPNARVPNVVGMELTDAKAELERAGYDVDVDDQSDALDFNEDNNTVCATRPGAEQLGKDDTVEVLAKSDAEDCEPESQRRAKAPAPPRVSRQSKARSRSHASTTDTSRGGHRARRTPRSGSALAALDALAVKGRAPMTGYDREQFGGDWASVNGCATRERILHRDLRRETYEPAGTCQVHSGRLADPYTATTIQFVRGGRSEVDIDHVVALGDAWQKGAQQWTYARRVEFANDPLNLLAVDASANRQKGDGDAATWLPPNKAFRCDYVARQIAVKRRYRVSVTRAEHDAMQRVLTRCPRTPLPISQRIAVAHTNRITPTKTPRPTPTPPPSSSERVFANCDAVRAAGRAPLLRGDPAYAAHLDRDDDGVACES